MVIGQVRKDEGWCEAVTVGLGSGKESEYVRGMYQDFDATGRERKD